MGAVRRTDAADSRLTLRQNSSKGAEGGGLPPGPGGREVQHRRAAVRIQGQQRDGPFAESSALLIELHGETSLTSRTIGNRYIYI